ncbi:putative transferase [Septoria linicola]|nr:putative transferase [Septoria linicola]
MFGKKKTAPPTVPTDEVVPMHDWDDKPHNRQMVVEFTYRFDDVLDAAKLKHALERLLEIGNWRKLGARVRLNAQGKLDYHIPQRYDEQRPGFLWDHLDIADSIEDHPLASQLAKAKPEPTIFEDPEKFHSLTAHPDHPTCLDDWIYSDRPPLSLRLVTFTDASLLTLSWSHTLLDAVGRQSLLEAWIAVLEGREQDVPPIIGFKDDPALNMGKTSKPEQHVLYKRMITGFRFFLFVVYFILEKVLHPKEDARLIQVPNSFVQNLKREAQDHLRAQSPEKEAPFLSDADVLFAWMTRLTYVAQNYSPQRTVTLMNVINFRGLTDALPLQGAAYIGNAVGSSQSFLTVQQAKEQPIAVTALLIREDLLRQKTPEQVDAVLAISRQLGRGPLFGAYDQLLTPWSNWHRARFYEMDFSSAVSSKNSQARTGKARIGKPSYLHVCGHRGSFMVRNGGALLGKDGAGNWWISWNLRAEAWEKFEAEFYKATRQ